MKEIALIAPYEDLVYLGRRVTSEMHEQIEIKMGLLDDGVKAARELEAQGCQVIISRGATAKRIKEQCLGISVVEIRLTGHDLIRSLAESRELGNRIGLIVFEDMVYDAKVIGNCLGVNVFEYLLREGSDLESAVNRAMQDGCQVLIGGASAVKFGQRMGIVSKLISSGKEAVWRAVVEAKEVARVTRQEQEKAEQFKAVLDYTYEGILVIDAHGIVTMVNPAAERILGIPASQVLNKNCFNVFSGFQLKRAINEGEPEVGSLASVKGKQLVLNKIPLYVNNQVTGVVATFQEVSKLQKIEQKIRKKLCSRGYTTKYNFSDIIGRSSAITQAIHNAQEFSRVDSTALITGETGVGKEMFAQSIHNFSCRAAGPFVAINCAVLPENLLESELFGYAEGAFTGARKEGRAGLFELAHGGTIFLDELGEMSPHLQSRLLRVLEEKEVMRLGDEQVIPIDVRVIAATNKDLQYLMEQGRFREDLYYRINVLKLHIPPLRNRQEDIPLLVQFFLKKYCEKFHKERILLSDKAVISLLEYGWPGNIRELENFIERLVVLASKHLIDVDDIRSRYLDLPDIQPKQENGRKKEGFFSTEGLATIEEETIKKVLEETEYNYSRAAEILGINRTTLWRKRKKFRRKQ